MTQRIGEELFFFYGFHLKSAEKCLNETAKTIFGSSPKKLGYLPTASVENLAL